MIVLLDSGPLGLLAHPNIRKPNVQTCNEWVLSLERDGHQVVIPEVIDYELRRELLRMGSTDAVTRLDQLATIFQYSVTTTSVWRRAANLWAVARRQGIPTAADAALDVDVILAAHGIELELETGLEVLAATTNARHLQRFIRADFWSTIR